MSRIVELASMYGRYGYRRITALLRREGWDVNHKRVERLWRREGLKVPRRQPKRGRLWLNDGSCVRLRPEWPNHVWSTDFVFDRTATGRLTRMLTVIDAFSQECLAIEVTLLPDAAAHPEAPPAQPDTRRPARGPRIPRRYIEKPLRPDVSER